MTDIVLVPVTGAANLSAINSNFSKIQNSVNNDVLNLEGGNNTMKQDIDMNGNTILNLSTDFNDSGSLVTVGDGDSRWYNVAGDTLTGPMNVNGFAMTGLAQAISSTSPVRKSEFDQLVSTLTSATGSFQQDGVGAVVRSFQDKMRDFVSEGDFSTNQQAAIGAFNKVYFLPEDTNTTITVPTDIPTLNDALKAVASWTIPASSVLTIKVNPGLYVSNTVVMDHAYAENILVTGEEPTLTTTITSFGSNSGVRGNYLVTLNVGSSTGLVAGNWVAIRATTGTGKFRNLNGFYEVVSAPSPTSVQLRVRMWDNTFPAMTLTAGNIYKVPTVLKFNNTDGIVLRASATTIYNLGIVGNMWDYWSEADIVGTEKGTHGVYVASNTIVDGAGTPGGANPYGMSGGGLACRSLHVADFDQQGYTAAGGGGIFGYGLYATSCGRRGYYAGSSASIEIRQSYAAVCYRDGAIADYGGAFNASGFQSNGHRLAGGFSTNGSSFITPNGLFTGNLGAGLDIRTGSYANLDAGFSMLNESGAVLEYGATCSISGATITANTVDGVALIHGSSLRATNAIITNNGRYGINSLASFVGRAGSTITGNTTANLRLDAGSVVFDGSTYEPTNNQVGVYSWSVVDTAKAHTTAAAVSSIGDFSLTLDGTTRLVLKADGTTYPSVDGAQTIGRDANRWSAGYARVYFLGTTGTVSQRSGTGSPEGNLSATVGSTYQRSDGGAGSTFYVKESGTGNTGWVAK